MRTISVKEAALALGLTPRAVSYRLEKGQLKGTLTKNETTGVPEWRIYPNKEILEKLKKSPPEEFGIKTEDSGGSTSTEQEPQHVPPQTPWRPQLQQRNPINQGAASQQLHQQFGKQASTWPSHQSSFMPGDLQVLPPELPRSSTREPGPADDFAALEESQPPESPASWPEGERLGWRNEDLEKQMLATAETFMKPLIEKVQELTKETIEQERVIEEQKKQLLLLPDLESQRAKLLREIEAERKAAEIQFNKIKEKEEEGQRLAAENERLLLEAEEARKKAEEAALSLEKLQVLEKQMLELKRPLWKKWFLPRPSQ